jgi:hypothetical protein
MVRDPRCRPPGVACRVERHRTREIADRVGYKQRIIVNPTGQQPDVDLVTLSRVVAGHEIPHLDDT